MMTRGTNADTEIGEKQFIKRNKKCLIYFNTRYYYSNIKNIALVKIYSYRYNTNNIHPYRDFIFNK